MTEPISPEHATPSQPNAPKQSFIERRNIHPLIFVLVVLGAIFMLYQIGGGVLTLLVVGSVEVTRENTDLVRLLTAFGQIVLILVPTLIFGRLLSIKLRRVFPFRLPTPKESLLAVIALLSLQRLFDIYMYLQKSIPLPESLEQVLEPMRKMMEQLMKTLVKAESMPELLFVMMIVAFVPAIVEEMMFRGLIQRTFERVVPPLAAAFITGGIFGLFHMNPFEIVPLVGLGCFLGYVQYRSQTLLVPMFLHFLNNAMAVMAVYLHMDDDQLLAAPGSLTAALPLIAMQTLLFTGLFIWSLLYYIRATAFRRLEVEEEELK